MFLHSLLSRFAKYYKDAEGVEYRTLIKAYGIRFDVMVNGKVRSLDQDISGPGRNKGGVRLLLLGRYHQSGKGQH